MELFQPSTEADDDYKSELQKSVLTFGMTIPGLALKLAGRNRLPSIIHRQGLPS